MEDVGQEQTLSSEGAKRKIVEDFELARQKVLEMAARLNTAAEHKRHRFDSPDAAYANSAVPQPSYPGLDMMSGKMGDNDARSFTFLELATTTKNFREANLIGEGGFGKEIAAKRLNSDGHQGNHEFIVEVLMLSLLHHPNLVKLIGYCAEGDHKLLVYEYMSVGSLSDHLYENGTGPILEWNTRMKIAVGAAKGIEYWWTYKGEGCRDLWSRGIWKNNSFSSCDC